MKEWLPRTLDSFNYSCIISGFKIIHMNKNAFLEKHVFGKEGEIISRYISDGPTKLKEDLKVSEADWRKVFDYLVFEKNLLYKVTIQNLDFFLDKYVKHGVTHVRSILDVIEPKYDEVFGMVFDLLVICNDGLYYHVLQHRDTYMATFKARGADFVRKVLGIWDAKYEESWYRILDILLHAVCDDIFSQQTFEHGLHAFSRIMNGCREHRPIYKSGLII